MTTLALDQSELDRPRTVVFVESAAAMGGVQFSTLYLAQRLDRTQWEPVVISPAEGELPRACLAAGIRAQVIEHAGLKSTSLRAGKGLRLPNPAAWALNGYVLSAAARKLRRFLAELRPALVVTKGMSAHFFGGLAAHQLGIPCVWHAQDLISERTFGIYRRAFGRAARWLPNEIIVDGASIAAQLPRSLETRVTVIHNGVDTKAFHPTTEGATVRQELGIPRDHLVIGHLARVTPWKGQHYLIEAFARIAAEHPRTTLLIVGSPVFDNDSYQQRLTKTVAQFGLQERVKFAGYRQDTALILAAMDVFAFTSTEKDTSPLALLSAMSCGLPIVAFDIDGVRELMATEDQFQLAPVADVEALGRVLAEVLADESLRRRLGAAARRQAVTQFDLDQCADKIQKVFRAALNRAPSSNTGQVIAEIPQSAAL